MAARFTYLEFFAGGGMARLGLGPGWRCLFANDFDPKKRDAYRANFGLQDHHGGDIHALRVDDLPEERADLAWASSPCQDLSLAGARGGLAGRRSGAFFGFWRLIEALGDAGRPPTMIVVENVAGLMTSHGGADFSKIVSLMAGRGYFVGALLVNAGEFVPQSRPRLFIVGARFPDPDLFAGTPSPGTAPALIAAVAGLPADSRKNWRWLAAAPSRRRNLSLADIVDTDAPFGPAQITRRRILEMSPRQRAVIEALKESGDRHVGAAFRRIRNERGVRRPRIEARFDGLAGCLRTPAGGSSRQIIFEIDAGEIRSRLMTPREAARSMGLPEDYILPDGTTAALSLIGDGVAPPVVRWLAENVLEPTLAGKRAAA